MAYRLPHAIVTKLQLQALVKELEKLTVAQMAKPSVWSDGLQQFLAMNRVSTLSATLRTKLVAALNATLKTSPQITVALADLPNSEEQTELVTWLRSRVHPQLLLHIVQDSDVMAGCVIRTDHNVYDLSLRSALLQNTDKLQVGA